MARIFISHSSHNDETALRLQDWLKDNGWSDTFLDLDPKEGLAPGEKWQEELRREADRCEAVLCLISQDWLNSPWCLTEFLLAKQLGKRIFPVIVGSVTPAALPKEMTAQSQAVDLVNDANGYARLREGLRRAGLQAESFPFPAGRPPYPGLEPLREEDAAIFFGREAQVVRALDRIRSLRDTRVERLFVILGASGAGKSSFMRAGLWPRLHRDDLNYLTLPTIRPERAPISGKFGLAASLEAAIGRRPVTTLPSDLPRTFADIRDYLDRSHTSLRELLIALRNTFITDADPTGPTPTLFVDQTEELFGDDEPHEVESFLTLLSNALVGPAPALCLMSIRSDSFPFLQGDERLESVKLVSFSLPPMLTASFRSVIEGPARLENIRLDPLLVEQLLLDTTQPRTAGGDALPILAFTLERLYRQHGAKGLITLPDYERLGKSAGAIADAISETLEKGRANRTVPRDPAEADALLKRIFIPHLVKIADDGKYERRIAEMSELPHEAAPMIELLTERRLLVKDRRRVGERESEVVEVAHEAILREWPAMVSWLNAERDFLAWRRRVGIARTEWEAAREEQKQAALLTGPALVQACSWLSLRRSDLDPLDVAYILASIPDTVDFAMSPAEGLRTAILVGGLSAIGLAGAFGKLTLFTQNEIAFVAAMLGIFGGVFEYLMIASDRRARVMNDMLGKVYPNEMRQVIIQKRNQQI